MNENAKEKLVSMEVGKYLELLGSDAPAPGGGSVSALAGAQGAELLSMVLKLTIGNKKYEEHHELCSRMLKEVDELKAELAKAIDEDTEAFNLVSSAFKMPKETDEEKQARREAIKAGTLQATKVPEKVMRLSLKGLECVRDVVECTNRNCDSDLGVSVLNFAAALRGAWLNVKINIPGLDDEDRKIYEHKGLESLEKGLSLADDLYKVIEERL